MSNGFLIKVEDLKTYFFTEAGTVKAVDGLDLWMKEGETLGLVGESGCGKTVTALSILRLVPDPPGRIVGGRVLFNGCDLISLDEDAMRRVRGAEMSMIFQEPMTSLNPIFTVGDQITEAIRLHQGLPKKEAWEKAVDMLSLVKIPDPERRAREYPHQLSGGMRQRVIIAMALSCNPRLLIADEPTTALDVTIQAQILELLQDLKEKLGMAIMLITHDLAVIAESARRVVVMYAGKAIEEAEVIELFENPLHPYTQGLLQSIPKVGKVKGARLKAIPGVVPSLLDLPRGCRFYPRCFKAISACQEREPELLEVKKGHWVRCILV